MFANGGYKKGGSREGANNVPLFGLRPNDTVLSYYGWEMSDVRSAIEFATAQHFETPNEYDAPQKGTSQRARICEAYPTILVLGHSFGGNAAWEFAKQLRQATHDKVKVDMVITFDPRVPHGEGGWDHSALKGGFDAAVDSRNYWHQGIPDFIPLLNYLNLTGYPLALPNRANDIRIDFTNHFDIIKDSYKHELQKSLDSVGFLRRSPDDNSYLTDAEMGSLAKFVP